MDIPTIRILLEKQKNLNMDEVLNDIEESLLILFDVIMVLWLYRKISFWFFLKSTSFLKNLIFIVFFFHYHLVP